MRRVVTVGTCSASAEWKHTRGGRPAVLRQMEGMTHVRIHMMTATTADVTDAIRYADRVRDGDRPVFAIRNVRYGSRSHTFAVDVVLTGNARHRSQSDRSEYAATYDEWGAFLAYLFDVDPDVKAGPYGNADEFDRMTDGAFRITHVGGDR